MIERLWSPPDKESADHSRHPEAVVSGDGDERLLAALYRLQEERRGERVEVAVVYGAAHAAAIVLGLKNRYGYQSHGAEWLTIADL